MLTKWVPEDSAENLPIFASHTVGVGGLVLSSCNEKILVIQERVQRHLGYGKHWKLPGGLLDPKGEIIAEGCQREVWEETGIKAQFKGILGFRELREWGLWGQPDLYFACLLGVNS
jgi:8-oxo-dGTP pyrophosphatase MutT (NUDIX family)